VSEASAHDLISNRAMWPDDFHDCITRIGEVASLDLDMPPDLHQRLVAETSGLLVDPALLDECLAALIAGHIVLQGPPGTGKSTLARALASAFNVELLAVTAHDDWSTFEVIGRQELRVDADSNEEIVPVNGHFTEAVIRCAGKIPAHVDNPSKTQATWLLIDELNRAHPDKAFGELFSVLGTDQPVDITLGYQKKGNDVLVVPRRFRIVATVNSIDKQFVNALSQGLRRRFTFLTFDIPPRRPAGVEWGSPSSLATKEFTVVATLAVERAARRTRRAKADLHAYLNEPQVNVLLGGLFAIVERVRYATNESDDPFVPVGTAPLIDTIELFLLRSNQENLAASAAGRFLDWATSVKFVPLLDAGSINREKLARLAESLTAPFDALTRRGILAIESDGLFYVQ
jgi:5-methylcytosine-specific restriction protein B